MKRVIGVLIAAVIFTSFGFYLGKIQQNVVWAKEHMEELREGTELVINDIDTVLRTSDSKTQDFYIRSAAQKFQALGGEFDAVSEILFGEDYLTAEWGYISSVLSDMKTPLSESEKDFLCQLQDANHSLLEELNAFEEEKYFWIYYDDELGKTIKPYREKLEHLVRSR